jgi:hypothetical protein
LYFHFYSQLFFACFLSSAKLQDYDDDAGQTIVSGTHSYGLVCEHDVSRDGSDRLHAMRNHPTSTWLTAQICNRVEGAAVQRGMEFTHEAFSNFLGHSEQEEVSDSEQEMGGDGEEEGGSGREM